MAVNVTRFFQGPKPRRLRVMMMMTNCFVVWLIDERRLALFPAGTIIRDAHHHESPTRRERGLNLRRTWVQAYLNELVH